jgi:GNAT superfamily N-acetyltransferase
VIRHARPEDVPEILAMVRELAEYERAPDEVSATEADLHHALFGRAPAAYCHVAEHESGELAGFALWFLNFSTWLGRHGVYLEDLFVRPAFRGHGYGRALLATLAGICADRGYGRLDWWVLGWNRSARDFYESLGATAMDEWVPYRAQGAALRDLATRHVGPQVRSLEERPEGGVAGRRV